MLPKVMPVKNVKTKKLIGIARIVILIFQKVTLVKNVIIKK